MIAQPAPSWSLGPDLATIAEVVLELACQRSTSVSPQLLFPASTFSLKPGRC